MQRRVECQGADYPFLPPRLLGDRTRGPRRRPYNSVLLLRSGLQRVAPVHVDELIGHQEIVVKSVGPQIARVPGVAGATVLADGPPSC